MESLLNFTPEFAAKAHELLAEQGDPALMVRVAVSGGGCSGFQYGFTFDAQAEDDATLDLGDGRCLIVDPLSAQYLIGAHLDYREDLEGSRFVINNPNAVTTCGCGSSFAP